MAAVAAGLRCRASPGRVASRAEQLALARPDSTRGRMLRSLAVALSLLVLGGSATCWYLDPARPATSRAVAPGAPSGFTRGALGIVE